MSSDLLPYQQRVVEEKAELSDKIQKLDAFIATSPLAAVLPRAERARLRAQRHAMGVYSAILAERIAAFNTTE